MAAVEQGDILRVGGLKYPVMAVSNRFFNESGKAVVCPVVPDAADGPLHIRVKSPAVEGVVLCEQVRYVDLAARRFVRLAEAHFFDVMDIADAVAGMFEWQTG